MRIIFLTNFYPPADRGGYGQWCQELAEGLLARDHKVLVLTSLFGKERLEKPDPAWIHRNLYLEMEFVSLSNGLRFFSSRKSRDRANLVILRQLVEEFVPDCMLIWGMWNLPRSLPALAEELMGERVAYYVGDYWLALPSQFEYYWEAPPRHWSTALPKKVFGAIAQRALKNEERPDLDLRHVIFASNFMRDELKRRGVRPQESKIIYGAIDTAPYISNNGALPTRREGDLSLLYIGRLSAEKGVHTAIEGLGQLVNHHKVENAKLNIVGVGSPEYLDRLRSLTQEQRVETQVRFLGAVDKREIPELYNQADIFLFTSVWPEPFGRVIVEAMASGVPVVGSCTGGAAEIMKNGENALTFSPGDADELAKQIAFLVRSDSLRRQIITNGRKLALEMFDISRMVSEVEQYLISIV